MPSGFMLRPYRVNLTTNNQQSTINNQQSTMLGRSIRVINCLFLPINPLPGKRSYAVRLYALPLQIE